MNVFAPNLANSVDFVEFGTYALDPHFYFEQKLDGVRLAVMVNNGKVTGINRSGGETPVDRVIAKALANVLGEWIFDGEWVDDIFWVFDLPLAPNIELRTPYALRRESLDAIVPVLSERTHDTIRLLPTHRTAEAKVAITRWVVEHNAEGLMIKDTRGTYMSGRRSNAMLKAKLVETAECVVLEVGREDKQSVAVGLYEDGVLVDVGSVKVRERVLSTIKPGDVIEVAYLYATRENRRLYQPVFRNTRSDKISSECTIDQLKYTDRSVLTTPLT